MNKKRILMIFAVMVMIMMQLPSSASTVEAASASNPKVTRNVTIKEGKSKTLKVSPKSSSKIWKLQKVTTSNKKVVTVSKAKTLGVKIKAKKAAPKPVKVKVYLQKKKGKGTKVLTCNVRVIPNPGLSKKKMTMKVGERQTLKVLPNTSKKIWSIKKVTTTDKTAVKLSTNKKKLTVGVQAKQKCSKVTIKVQLQMKKSAWKKYKKYLKSKKTTLKCVIEVTDSTSETPVESEEPEGSENPNLEVIDVSGIQYTGLTSVYDGTPKYVGYDQTSLPEGIETIIFEGDGVKNSGKYEVIARFMVDTSKYAVPLPVKLNLTINKATTATISLDENSFNSETNQIVANIGGVLDEASANYTVNRVACEGVPIIAQPGRYKVTADLATNNYENPGTKEAVFNVKRQNLWYQFALECERVDNQVIVKIYLKDVNIKFAEDYTLLALGFDLLYDKSILELDEFVSGEGWDVSYNSERDNSKKTGSDILAMYFSEDPMPEESMVCTIVYNIIDQKKFANLEFTLDNAISSTGDEDLPFEYTTDSETIILNPTNELSSEYTVYMNWDLLYDAMYTNKDDTVKAEYVDALRKYISTIF